VKEHAGKVQFPAPRNGKIKFKIQDY